MNEIECSWIFLNFGQSWCPDFKIQSLNPRDFSSLHIFDWSCVNLRCINTRNLLCIICQVQLLFSFTFLWFSKFSSFFQVQAPNMTYLCEPIQTILYSDLDFKAVKRAVSLSKGVLSSKSVRFEKIQICEFTRKWVFRTILKKLRNSDFCGLCD